MPESNIPSAVHHSDANEEVTLNGYSIAYVPAEYNRIDASHDPLGYQWPASRLSHYDMKRLSIIRHATNKPITRLLQDAVDLLWEATEAERKLDHQRIEQLCTETRARTEQFFAEQSSKRKQQPPASMVAEEGEPV